MRSFAFLAVPALGTVLTLVGCATGDSSHSGANPTQNGAPAATITVKISGDSQIRAGATVDLSAAVSGSANQAVTWTVNGITGGTQITGTISAAGVYIAPLTLPPVNPVTVSAISQASATASASLPETVLNPIPVIAAVSASQTGSSPTILIDVMGSSFVTGAKIKAGGQSIGTTFVSSNELRATLTSSTTSALAISVENPDPGSSLSDVSNAQIQRLQVSLPVAARLLDQATFGPTPSDVAHVQSTGIDAYLKEQFDAAPTLMATVPTPLPAGGWSGVQWEQSEWWQAALTGKDQLRQRAAYAFSNIFVISTAEVGYGAVIPFQNILVNDAFGNFSDLLHDVTLSTGMGGYLNMLHSAKPGAGQIANENFARESMQLFSIGLNELNQDGTLKLDSDGEPIPTYSQAQVQAFARAYTGWTYATAAGESPTNFPNWTPNFNYPMMPVENEHDTQAKALLDGTTLPAGQTAEQDLAASLANIFANQNVGPFICRQLIQHLVTSNPTPAYVGRVAAVFANNGAGVRGDLKAVLQAILTDAEARAGDTDPTFDGGHLREPVLYMANVMRGLGYVNTDPNSYYGSVSNNSEILGQEPYGAQSVFNFFPPSYVLPGSNATAPEFGLENSATAMTRLTDANNLVANHITGFNVDLSATSAFGQLAAQPVSLVDYLGDTFMHGQMPVAMRSNIVDQIASLSDLAARVRIAIYLTVTSSLYKVEH